ncbi:MAG TPA: response regulator transcription factor [Phycisphaerales bacterium]|nr:response regulator transcription factor [Phycisphaerales bacterium]
MSSMNVLPTSGAKARVFCADDNPLVSDALRLFVLRSGEFDWAGCVPDADQLCANVRAMGCPEIVLLDIDMPGMDPFTAISQVAACCPETRVLMYSGMVRRDLIDRAIEAGAWGYVSKGDGEQALFEAMRTALDGQIAMSPEVRAVAGL